MEDDYMRCPICGSDNVIEMDNLHCTWACGDCGHTGDGADFDASERGFIVPDPSKHHPDCQCSVCVHGQDAWLWLNHPSEY